MHQEKIPACYFPTSVIFIDDNLKHLKELSLDLDDMKFAPKFFSDPKAALNELKKYQPSSFMQRWLLRTDEMQLDHRSVDIDLPAIRGEIYNLNRFSEISIIVVDYAMPDINGLELCRQLRHKPFKKLMLTAEADEKIAVQAFNERTIDKFIRKDAPNFHELINSSIQELQQQYFQELSSPILKNINTSADDHIHSLDDPVFADFFYGICKKNNISEYYLADSFGSFLLLNFEGMPSWLAVKDEAGMQTTYEIAEGSDTPFPPKLLQDIEKREKIYYLYGGDFSDDPKQCEKYTYPAKTLQGKVTYYYAYIDNPNTFDIQRNKIIPYKNYLEKVHSTSK